MDHVAIMRKSWGLIPKILSGEKTIESRWYKNKAAPWGKINTGDMVYFKNSGERISLKARVKRVNQFEKLSQDGVRAILREYGKDDGIDKDSLENYFNLFKDKRYCLLIFLENPEVIEPFQVDKTGWGAMAAWICVEDVKKIKIQES